jgi:hypothetical protein
LIELTLQIIHILDVLDPTSKNIGSKRSENTTAPLARQYALESNFESFFPIPTKWKWGQTFTVSKSNAKAT